MSALGGVHVLFNNQSVNAYDVPSAWATAPCPHCGGNQALRVAFCNNVNVGPYWYRCVTCLKGFVKNGNLISPGSQPLRTPAGLPPIDLQIWTEVRTCLGSGAHAATVMLCRKLLFHIAVAHGLPAKNEKDRAPNFYEAVEHLQGEGLITKKMRPWVDRIKDVGNDANHELTPISAELAVDVATFTEQLLVLAYELDALMAQQAGHEET